MNWLEKISEENKKGLRIIQKVVEVEGRKRFRREDGAQDPQKKALTAKDV
jgi:hypothetical protein